MAKPIQHNAFDTVEEAAYGGVKYAALGAVASFVVGAAAVGAAALVASAFVTVSLPLVGVAALATGAATAFMGGTTSTLVGGLIGIFKGANKASKENAAYAAKMREAQLNPQAQIIEAQNAGMQQGYAAAAQQLQGKAQEIYAQGMQAGQTEVLKKIEAEQAAGGHADKQKPHGSHVAAHDARKEAAAGAAHGVGA